MPLTGKGKRSIFVLAESPGAEEDARNTQLVGPAGIRLRAELAKFNISLDEDCFKMNAISCRPPDNRTPTPEEVAACRPNVLRAIAKHKPKLILLLGRIAMESVVGHSNKDIAYGKSRGFPLLRGKLFPDRAYPGSWLGCTFHPSYVLRVDSDEPVVPVTWHNDLARFLEDTKALPSIDTDEDDLKCLRILSTPVAIIPVLKRVIQKHEPIAIDYETTGLKPHAKGHKVVSVGFATGIKEACAFKMGIGNDWTEVRKSWARILEDPAIGKIAHNVPFEWNWSKHGFGVVSRGWIADTQVLCHLEDSRKGHSSLKVQSYLKFGIADYDDLDRFKDAPKAQKKLTGCNAFNTMDKAPTTQLLRYNAKDALYEYRLWKWFQKQGVAAPKGSEYEAYG
jgi:uracil-DNA glycosylase family 4